MQNFNLQAPIGEWGNSLYKKSIMIVGQSGIGKTQFGKAFCLQHKWKTLVVNHVEKFPRIDLSVDAVIIEYDNFNRFHDTEKLAIFDNSVAKTRKVIYQTVRKKQGVVMIISINHMQYKDVHHVLQ